MYRMAERRYRPNEVVLLPFKKPFSSNTELIPTDAFALIDLFGPALVVGETTASPVEVMPDEFSNSPFSYWLEAYQKPAAPSSTVVLVQPMSHPHLTYPIPLDRLLPWTTVQYITKDGFSRAWLSKATLELSAMLKTCTDDEERDQMVQRLLLLNAWMTAIMMSSYLCRCPHPDDLKYGRLAEISGEMVVADTWEAIMAKSSFSIMYHNTIFSCGDVVMVPIEPESGTSCGFFRISHFTSTDHKSVKVQGWTLVARDSRVSKEEALSAIDAGTIVSACYDLPVESPELGLSVHRPLELFDPRYKKINIAVYKNLIQGLKTATARVTRAGLLPSRNKGSLVQSKARIVFHGRVAPELVYVEVRSRVESN